MRTINQCSRNNIKKQFFFLASRSLFLAWNLTMVSEETRKHFHCKSGILPCFAQKKNVTDYDKKTDASLNKLLAAGGTSKTCAANGFCTLQVCEQVKKMMLQLHMLVVSQASCYNTVGFSLDHQPSQVNKRQVMSQSRSLSTRSPATLRKASHSCVCSRNRSA